MAPGILAVAQPSGTTRGPLTTTRILALMTAVSVGQFSCRCFECLSRAVGMAAGESISFHFIDELENYIVSCQ